MKTELKPKHLTNNYETICHSLQFINGTLKCDYNHIILITAAVIKKGVALFKKNLV
jgi:hypothetical protein